MMSIEQYIAANNTTAAQQILQKYGLKPTQSWDDLHAKLRAILSAHKDDAAKVFAQVDTPYKRLIEANMEPVIVEKQVTVTVPTETKHNADGGCNCGGKCGGNTKQEPQHIFYRADGGQAAPPVDHLKYIQPILLAGFMFGLGYLIAQKTK